MTRKTFTPDQRRKIVERAQRTSAAWAAAEVGISEGTVRKWASQLKMSLRSSQKTTGNASPQNQNDRY